MHNEHYIFFSTKTVLDLSADQQIWVKRIKLISDNYTVNLRIVFQTYIITDYPINMKNDSVK